MGLASDKRDFDTSATVVDNSFAARAAFKTATNLHKAGAYENALKHYHQALNLQPDMPECLNDMGVTLRKMGKLHAAAVCYQKVLRIQPYDGRARGNLANVYQQMGRFEQALALSHEVLSSHPHFAENWYCFGVILRDMGRIQEAASYLGKALDMEPDNPKYRWDFSLSLLQRGKFKTGFRYFEARWELAHSSSRFPDIPRWKGQSLKGKRILVHREQGFGDMIQFIRFVPALKHLGASHVIVESKQETSTLFESVNGIDKVVIEGDSISDVDFTLPMMSLARVLETTIDTIPNADSYLTAPSPNADDVKLFDGRKGLKIGIAWAGSATHKNDHNRSCNLEHFASLMSLPDTHFYSLQKGTDCHQLDVTALHHMCHDLGPVINNFSDTARLVNQLDLVICVDTSVAHLAGAMGKEVWVAQAKASDWRWLTHRSDSPWYRSLRLFQQPAHGDWETVFTDIRHALMAQITEID